MAKKTRDKLKILFSRGRLPSELDFADLIDSTINPADDGFDISQVTGIKIRPTERHKLLSIYARHTDAKTALWQMELDNDGSHLHLKNLLDSNLLAKHKIVNNKDGGTNPDNHQEKNNSNSSLLSFSANEKKVGINRKAPAHTLDINGTLACSGRVGNYNQGRIIADGRWHDVLTSLTGCKMFEVIAGVGGKKGQGRYALLKATVMSTYHGTRWLSKLFGYNTGIFHQHCHFYSRWDRIRLRWIKAGLNRYTLQMRTIRNYCDKEMKIYINYSMTQLWFDDHMCNSHVTHDGEEELA
ncbi:hypothetical protein [Spartinivicinus poritis]|uniref:LAGLIDADG homing endonuclease n=1 Tax=Spartinivicinus poritis TaxID=2994640 RepID=A0ABT5U2T3_9GAMM|nr:hypothetical protein [Spartinivicinus sp. A2-2]MDE1460674.1 hypothetical protein [Spartinivicinus sp. A2-2]